MYALFTEYLSESKRSVLLAIDAYYLAESHMWCMSRIEGCPFARMALRSFATRDM